MKLSEYIREYRRQNNISMQELADSCGVTKAYISLLENGKSHGQSKEVVPSIVTMQKLAKGMGVPLDKLLNNSESKLSLSDDEKRMMLYRKHLDKLNDNELEIVLDYADFIYKKR